MRGSLCVSLPRGKEKSGMLCVCTFQSRQISTNFIRSATVPYTMIIDTHCHLASAQFDQSRRETYVQHALREGIDRMITLGARMDDWEANTAWARQFPGAVFVRWASIRTMPMTPRQTGRTSFPEGAGRSPGRHRGNGPGLLPRDAPRLGNGTIPPPSAGPSGTAL